MESVDMAVVITAHSKVDYEFVRRRAKAVFDTKRSPEYYRQEAI